MGLLLLVAILTVQVAVGEGKKTTRTRVQRCAQMDLTTLCSEVNIAKCRSHLPDVDVLCLNHKRRPTSEVSLIKARMVPYYDASIPVILEGPGDVTVAPGTEFTLNCLAEGAPTPHVQITRLEEADMSKLDETNALEVELGLINVVHKQPGVIEQDEGWYRCVARNSQGVVSADSYVTVKDLCADVECPAQQICLADYEAGVAECTCPTFCDYPTPDYDSTVCGSNCVTYFGECALQEDNCYQGTNFQIFKHSFCPEFSLPEFTHVPTEQLIYVKKGEVVTLTCSAKPAGDNPGPPPLIRWYAEVEGEYTEIGAGEVLEREMGAGDLTVSCVAHHCSESEFQAEVPGAVVEIVVEIEEESTRSHAGSACQVFGDPYINTYDNLWYKHDGVCSYVLSMDCVSAQWYVYGMFATCGAGTCLQSVTLYYGREFLELQRGWIINQMGDKLAVKVNQEQVISADLSVLFDGEYIILNFGKENQIRWDGFNSVQILTWPALRTCGLCGNNNRNPNDEFYARWAGPVENRNNFVSSWQLNFRDYNCYIKDNYDIQSSEAEATAKCAAVFNNDFVSRCSAKVDASAYKAGCVRSALTNQFPEDYQLECAALQNYLLSCETAGGTTTGWREATGCDLLQLQRFTIAQGCPQENPPV